MVNGLSSKVLSRYAIDVRMLEVSSHFYYSPEDTLIVKREFEKMISK